MDSAAPVLILFFLLLEGIFSGGEIALVACDPARVRQRAEAGSKSASLVLRLLKKPEWFFAATVAGTDLCIVAGSTLATLISVDLFGPVRGPLISPLVMIPVILIFGEIIPKSLFQKNPETVAERISWFIWAVSWIFFPVIFLVAAISRLAVRIFLGKKGQAGASYITKGGLKFLLKERGAIVSEVRVTEKEMVRRIFDFSETTVNKIMVPIANVTALEKGTIIRDAALLFRGKWYSRVPVYNEKIFNITGILHGFDLLGALPEESARPVADFARANVFFVPETKRASELLIEMQKRGEQMAVVVDEYGGAVGIVTVEDLLEEVVGEIEDEYDKGERAFRKLAPGRFLFKAKTGIEHIRELIQLEIPSGPYETVAGFLLDRMGRIPRKGERYRFGEALFIVEDADAKSIREVLIVLPYDVNILG
ncbi:MAG TPA: hemolysin family protein [Syntrophales bacterium]|mgnify:CR=1 FL=1|nr:hemolysin family protein [Syntrophales bacterium]